MAKDNSSSSSNSSNSDENNSNNLSIPSTSTTTGTKRAAFRSKPYDANNSLVRKVAIKMTDLIPHHSWISKWFNSSQDETSLQTPNKENPQYKAYDEKHLHPPPVKRPCIRMDVTHPPGTFTIKPRNRNLDNVSETPKEHYSNYNETTRDFLEPSTTSPRLHRFVSSTPAYSISTKQVTDSRSALNMLMSEQNNNGAANGMDDNSESSESTSGCSSLIPQNNRQEAPSNVNYSSSFGNKRRYIDDKLNFTNHLQSPRSLFSDNSARETLSSRRPSFNALMMNNSLERSSSLSSPFYPGNTMFGGANAANLYKRSSSVLSEPLQYNLKAPKRTNVEVNPSSSSSTSDLSGMSHTARRILEALEQFSSPLSDAKKMPIKNIMSGGNQTPSPTSNRKRVREDDSPSPRVGLRHLTRELTVPTVPDLLRIRRRQKLQNTTINARKIMTSRATPTMSAPASQDYHIRTEADVELKHNTQLKAKKKMNLEKQETIETVNLPTIPLPISSLPRFDISLPQCIKVTKPVSPDRQQQQSMFKKDNSYKFASPIRLGDGAKNVESINNFTFSKPITPSKMITTLTMNESYDLSKTLSVDSNDTLSCSSSFTNFIWTGPSQTLKTKEKDKDKEKESRGPKVASELKTGSVMDFFTKKSSASSDLMSTWECNECLIKNNEADIHCVACKSSKPANSSDDIEILECFPSKQESKHSSPVQENHESAKSSTKIANQTACLNVCHTSSFSCANTTTVNTSSAIFTETSTKSGTSSVISVTSDDKAAITTTSPSIPTVAKTIKSSWECPCCMVRNLDNVSTCPCCNTAKPGTVNVSPERAISESDAPIVGFGDKFKKPKGSWSCDTCMIQNKVEAEKCVACETPRTDTVSKVTTTPGSGFGDMFKKPIGSWICDSCMIQNKPEDDKCVACESAKPGTEASDKPRLQFNVDMPANASEFVFGIDKSGDTTTATPSKTNGFTFGNGTTQSIVGGFSFGMPSTSKVDNIDTSKAIGGFGLKVGETVATTATFQFGSKSTETNEKKPQQHPATVNFSFGIPVKSDVKVTNSGFVFGMPPERKAKEKNEVKHAASPGFVFAPQATQSNDKTIDSSESKTTSEAPVPAKFIFGTSKPVTTTPAKEQTILKVEEKAQIPVTETPKLSATTFVAPTELQKQPLPSFSFGMTSAPTNTGPSMSTSTEPNVPKSTGPNASTMFIFSGQSNPTDAPQPAFGSATALKPTFSFGKAADTTTSPNIVLQQQPTNKSNTITFGRPAVTPSFSAPMNQATSSLFGNMNATPSTVSSTLGASSNKPLIFGAPSENKVKPTFGESETKLPVFALSSSGFGTSTNVFGGSSTTPSFGANTTSGIFTSTKPLETASPNPNLFSFGQSLQATAPAASGFNFSSGSNANNTNDQKSIFAFGASSSGINSGGGGGSNGVHVGNSFGGSGNFSTTAPNFSFSATPKPEAPVNATFGQATNASIFSVSSAVAQSSASPPAYPGTVNPASNSTTPFSFGSTNVPTSFNFGASPTPSTSGFNFNAPTNPTTPVTFDPNVQPTFNFTAGSAPAVFNAPPARKIKKAVRRMPRQ